MTEKLPHNRNPLTDVSVGSFGISGGTITRKTQNKTKQKTYRICI